MKLISLCSLLLTQVSALAVPARDAKESSATLIQAINQIESETNYTFTYLKTMMAYFSGYLDNFDFNKYPNLTMILPTDAAFQGFSLSSFSESSKVLSFVQYYALRNHYDNSSFPANATAHLTTYSEEDLAFYKNATGSLSIQGRYDHNATVVAFTQYKQIKALVVEKLIYPAEPLYETAKSLNLTWTTALLNASQIPYESQNQKNFTIFLPTEKAISELVTSTCKTVENIKPFKLTSLLALHTRVGKIYSEQFASYNNSRLLSVSGESLNFTITDKAVLSSISTNATILATDLLVKGGVIHVIDKVLVPANFDTKDYCISN